MKKKYVHYIHERAPGEPKGELAFLNFKFYKIIHKYALKPSKVKARFHYERGIEHSLFF